MGKATEDVGSSEYFKKLFGNITKGGLSLFSSKNPFYRKQEQDSDVGVDGAFEQVKRKNRAESGETSDQAKKKLRESGKNKNTGQETSGTEVVGDDAENLDIGSKNKRTYGKIDEHLAIGKKKKDSASENGEFITANNDSSGKKKKKSTDVANNITSELRKVNTDVPGEKDENTDLRTLKNASNSENGEDSDIKGARKKGGSEQVSARFMNNSNAQMKKQVNGDGNNNNLGQEKTETEIAIQNDANEYLRTKTKKDHSGNEEAVNSNVDHADKKKKKKCKEKLIKEGLNGKGDSGSLEDISAKVSVKSQIENDKRKKNERNKKKLNKEGSDRKGNAGFSDEDPPNMGIQIQSEDDKHGLLGMKRKEYMLEDLARARKKRIKVSVEENRQSALRVQEYEMQDMPRENHGKRKLEQENIEPSKRMKVCNQHFDDFEGGDRKRSKVVTESKEKSLSELKVKSVSQKRKWDAFEEEDDARHGLGDGEYTSKDVVLPMKIKGKRKWGEEALDMVVNKKDRDDNEKLERTVFIGNLPLGFKRKKLIREFSQFGEVESLRLRSVPLVDSKLPRKGAILKGKVNDSINSVHAYIVFKDAQSVNAALSRNMTEFGGNHIRVDRALPPRKKLKDGNHSIYDTRRTVFVGNLPFDVKDEELYQLFVGIVPMESGVEAVRVIRDPQTSMGKGIAYVLFKSTDAAKLALKKKNLKLKDRSLRLCKTHPENRTAQTASTSKSRSDTTPRFKALNRKHLAESRELSNTPLQKKAKSSLSYQGTKASKTDKHPIKSGSVGMHNPQANEPKTRMFKRPAVAARRENAGQNLGGKKRKRAEKRTSYSKSLKKMRVH